MSDSFNTSRKIADHFSTTLFTKSRSRWFESVWIQVASSSSPIRSDGRHESALAELLALLRQFRSSWAGEGDWVIVQSGGAAARGQQVTRHGGTTPTAGSRGILPSSAAVQCLCSVFARRKGKQCLMISGYLQWTRLAQDWPCHLTCSWTLARARR